MTRSAKGPFHLKVKRHRLLIKNHRTWKHGKKCGYTNYRWSQACRAIFKVWSNKDNTLRDLADVAFEHKIKLKVEHSEVKQ